MSEDFNIVIFTASKEYYADAIIDYIDPECLICKRYFR